MSNKRGWPSATQINPFKGITISSFGILRGACYYNYGYVMRASSRNNPTATLLGMYSWGIRLCLKRLQ